jgi:hypothetical protein
MPKISQSFFSCPFPVQISPDAPLAREADARWQREFGLIRSDERAVQVDAWRTDLLMARTYPLARGNDLVLATNFCNYFFNFDDQFDGTLGLYPDQSRQAVQPLVEMVARQAGENVVTAAEESPAISGFRNLWQQLSAPMSWRWQDRFAEQLTSYLRMYAWEAANRAASRVPDWDTYRLARRPTSAVGLFLILAERVQREETPPEIWYAPEFLEMFRIAIDHVAWTNDVIALERESSRHDVHNIVFSLQKSHDWSQDRAVNHCRDLISTHVERFIELKQRMPDVHDRLSLTPAAAHAVDVFVECSMESWMSANLDWAFLTDRYDQHGDLSLTTQEAIFQ